MRYNAMAFLRARPLGGRPAWRNGRRKGLKIPRPQKRTSSSLVAGTIIVYML